MSEIKWIKIVVDMFEDSKIEFIRSLPEGDSIIVTWIQMMSIAGKSNMGGYLMVTDDIPYSEQFLSTKLKRSPVFVQFALETLMKLKMINIEDGPYHITNWEKHQNVDGMEKVKLQNKERKRKQREREKLLLLEENAQMSRDSHVTVTKEVTPCHAPDIDLEIDKELKHIVVSKESDIAFERFYGSYPKGVGSVRKKALESWRKIWRSNLNVDEIIEGVNRYSRYQIKQGYRICAAQVFLNQERWKDDWESDVVKQEINNSPRLPDLEDM